MPRRAADMRARALAGLLAVAALWPAGRAWALEPIESFPRTMVDVRTHAGHQWFDTAVADTYERAEQGLMFVRRLPADQAMLFPQDSLQVASMWMKNTLIPLDMLFIDGHGRIACLLANLPPLTLDIRTCPTPVAAVLEIGGGEAAGRGIRVGDRVQYRLSPAGP